MKIYDKLVRDEIVVRLSKLGIKCEFESADEAAFGIKLDEKLSEEVSEFLKAGTPDKKLEELADILEVVYAQCRKLGFDEADLENVRTAKETTHGGFQKKIILISTEET